MCVRLIIRAVEGSTVKYNNKNNDPKWLNCKHIGISAPKLVLNVFPKLRQKVSDGVGILSISTGQVDR